MTIMTIKQLKNELKSADTLVKYWRVERQWSHQNNQEKEARQARQLFRNWERGARYRAHANIPI